MSCRWVFLGSAAGGVVANLLIETIFSICTLQVLDQLTSQRFSARAEGLDSRIVWFRQWPALCVAGSGGLCISDLGDACCKFGLGELVGLDDVVAVAVACLRFLS